MTNDIYNNKIEIPTLGTKVLRDGFEFSVINIELDEDISMVANITLRGRSGVVEVGYYDFLKHTKI